MKQSRVKVNAHVISWRGLLLIYDCAVFGDTSENIDRVLVRAFCLSTPQIFGLIIFLLIIFIQYYILWKIINKCILLRLLYD